MTTYYPVACDRCPCCGQLPRRYWTPARIIDAIQRFVAETGDVPTWETWRRARPGHPNFEVLRRMFGSPGVAIRLAGYEQKSCRSVYWTRERIVEAITSFTREHGRSPKTTEWIKATAATPTNQTVLKVFGTWNAALTAAGVPARDYRHRWSREEILEAMRAWHREYGAPPTTRDWKHRTDKHPTADGVAKIFGSWNAARVEAGFWARRGASGFYTDETLARQVPPVRRPTEAELRAEATRIAWRVARRKRRAA